MTDTQRASQIPFMSPRTLSSPSALPSPNLGLISPSRYPSVSGSPTLPAPTSPSTSSSGGSTPFRTFKNFLSLGIGSSKNPPSTPSPSAIPKSHFSTLGPIRRSVQVKRHASSPQLKVARRSDDDYVLAIDLPRPGDDRSTHTSKSGGSLRTPLSQTTPHPHSTTTNTQCTSIAHPCSGKELSAEKIAQSDWIRATTQERQRNLRPRQRPQAAPPGKLGLDMGNEIPSGIHNVRYRVDAECQYTPILQDPPHAAHEPQFPSRWAGRRLQSTDSAYGSLSPRPWYANLATCSLFNTLHLQQYAGIGSRNGLSHKSSFLYVFLCLKFVWYSFPGYIFHWALSYFN